VSARRAGLLAPGITTWAWSAGKWVRPALTAPATFVEPNGSEIVLAPGRTWEELVPYEDAVSATSASNMALRR